MTSLFSPLRHWLRPLLLIVLLFFVLTGVLGIWVSRAANQRALDVQRTNAEMHFVAAISQLEQRWGWEAFSFKTRIESLRYLEATPRQLEKLTAHLTSLGRSIEFPWLRVEDAKGELVYSYEYLRRSAPKVWFRTGQTVAWVVDAEHLYMVFRQPVWLGKEDGYLLLYKPMDHALLTQIGYPATRLSLWWQEKPLASSEGYDGLAAAQKLARQHDDGRIVRIQWPGVDSAAGPMLMVELASSSLMQLVDLATPLLTGLLLLVVGLLLILVLVEPRSGDPGNGSAPS